MTENTFVNTDEDVLPPQTVVTASKPSTSSQYIDYSVNACFNKRTGKFQRLSSHSSSLNVNSNNQSSALCNYYFDYDSFSQEPRYLQPNSSTTSKETSTVERKISRKELKAIKERKAAKKKKKLKSFYLND